MSSTLPALPPDFYWASPSCVMHRGEDGESVWREGESWTPMEHAIEVWRDALNSSKELTETVVRTMTDAAKNRSPGMT